MNPEDNELELLLERLFLDDDDEIEILRLPGRPLPRSCCTTNYGNYNN